MAAICYNAGALEPFILYADNHILAINKPAGLLTQDSGTGKRNMEDWAREWVRVDKQKEGKVFLNAVHRIDRVVSGVVLFARTSKALTRLNEEVRSRNCRKIYYAVVQKRPDSAEETLVHWLRHVDQRAEIGREGAPDAQRAELSYRWLGRTAMGELLEVDLKTGRYHQIRAQLAAIGSPILGDLKYGSERPLDDGRIALHHHKLVVMHPTLKEMVDLVAPCDETALWR
jgi:23S rRNA pseudouridine1911/1915/1917 synthase